jgi:hypothetical protein
MAAMHAHGFAAIEASPDTQGTAAAAAAKTPVDSAAAAAIHLAAEAAVAVAAESAVAVAAADAGAGVAAYAAAQTVRDKAVCQEACSHKNKSPHHADQPMNQMGLGWHPSKMQGRQHQHGDTWQDEEEVQNTFLPRIAEMQPGIKVDTEHAQQQAEEEKTPAQQVEGGDRSIQRWVKKRSMECPWIKLMGLTSFVSVRTDSTPLKLPVTRCFSSSCTGSGSLQSCCLSQQRC